MIKAIAFDLDDTLIDTSKVLLPLATVSAYKSMVSQGLPIDFKTFEDERKIGVLSMAHKKIFKVIADKYGQNFKEEIAAAGIEAFYNPVLPDALPILAGANENLLNLSKKYTLFVVTAGSVPTQKKKVEASGLSHFFKKAYTIDGFKNERKRVAFEDILKNLALKPEELISIGNRLSQEIHDAKELGCITCHFNYGEHVGELARNDFEIPDFRVESHKELISTCRL